MSTAPALEPASIVAPSPPWKSARERRGEVRALRRRLRRLSLLGPTLWIVGGDLLRRPTWIIQFDGKHVIGYLLSILLMTGAWHGLLFAASTRRGRLARLAGAIFVFVFTLPAAVQPATYSIYREYFSLDAAYFIDSIPWIFAGSLPLRPRVVFSFAAALAVALVLLFSARKVVRPRGGPRPWLRWLFALPAALLPGSGGVPVSYQHFQSTTPELIYWEGVSYALGNKIRRLRKHDPLLVRYQGHSPARVPALSPKPARSRNVLMIVQEAQRADVTCTAFTPGCPEANIDTNLAVPQRIPLLQMRSMGSSTAIAIFSLYSGMHPVWSRAEVEHAPFLWDYAEAAGYDTAYWTSQMPMFSSYRLFFQGGPFSHACMGSEVEAGAEILAGASDERLTDRVLEDLGQLKEPFFAVVQYSNIHHPRIVDPDRSPFLPNDPEKDKGELKNFYKDAVYLSDRAVARLLVSLRKRRVGDRTVVVFTSDHGEALYEHHNENFHSSTLYEEEIRIPTWVDAPKDTLAPDEERSLRRSRNDPLFQTDLAATALDLLGLWELPELSPFKKKMLGLPLTRAARATGPVPLTNVGWTWEYNLPNWGMMEWPLKLFAGPEDKTYRCFDVSRDPREKHDLGEAGCPKLVAAARALYGRMPADIKEERLRAFPGFGVTAP